MRLIDADALMQLLGITDMDCNKCAWNDSKWNRCKRGSDFEEACCAIENALTIQPERLTDDDFETIRILLNADKEKLCNQHRWKEAEEYQRIIDRFMAFASAQPEIVRCKDCKHQIKEWRDDKRFKDKGYWVYGCKVMSDLCGHWNWFGQDDEFCSEAERRTDETD